MASQVSVTVAVGARAHIDPQPISAADVPLTLADISRARAELGYAPRNTSADGAQKYARWCRQEGLL